MTFVELLAVLFVVSFDLIDARGVIWDSPCPKHFQYGFLDQVPIGILDVHLPVESLNSFNVTLDFLPKSSYFKDPLLAPKIELLNEFAPIEIVRDTRLGLATRFIVHYTKSGPLFNYKLVNVLLNGGLLCSSDDSKY